MSPKRKVNSLNALLNDLSRIKEWWILTFSFVFFAYIPNLYRVNGDVITFDLIMEMLTSPSIYIALIVVFMAQIFLFASNDYFDRNIDALDKNKRMRNPVCNGSVTPKAVKVLLVITGIIPMVGAFYFNFQTVLFTAFSLVVFFYYTAEPLRIKKRVGLDVLAHGMLINTFPYFFCLMALPEFSIGALFLLFALMMRSAMAQILQEVRDYDTDRKVEKNTAVVLGPRGAIRLVFTLYILLTFSTLALMLTEYLYGIGIAMFYSIILILCVSYIPVFVKLLRAKKNYGKLIEKLWVGQGRATFGMGIRYVGSFALYFVILFAFLI